MPKKLYPDHIYDPIRHEIAAERMAKELRRGLPNALEDLNPPLTSRLRSWFDTKNPNLAPVYDFWNLFEGIVGGIRIKNSLIKLLTASNTEWFLTEVALDEVTFTWQLPELKLLGETPIQGKQVREKFQASKAMQKKLRKQIENQPDPMRPMIFKSGDALVVQAGNYDCLRGLIYNETHLAMWVGNFTTDPTPRDYWVSMSLLNNLAQLARTADHEGDKNTVEAVRTTLRRYFKESRVARINYDLRVGIKSEFNRSLVE